MTLAENIKRTTTLLEFIERRDGPDSMVCVPLVDLVELRDAASGREHVDLIHKIRVTAKKHGWAIGVHGSLRRDIDLIAVPWTYEAVPWIDLWMALAKEVPLERAGMHPKPFNRMGCVMLQVGSKMIEGTENFVPPQVDISFMAEHPMHNSTDPKDARIRALESALHDILLGVSIHNARSVGEGRLAQKIEGGVIRAAEDVLAKKLT